MLEKWCKKVEALKPSDSIPKKGRWKKWKSINEREKKIEAVEVSTKKKKLNKRGRLSGFVEEKGIT